MPTITLLGTGTSDGIPRLGCGCEVCSLKNPDNRRLRTSAAIRFRDNGKDRTIIIDTGLDFRQQMLENNLKEVDAVLYTHSHADHVEGITELRPLSLHRERRIPCYGNETALTQIRKRFEYMFGEHKGGGNPQVDLHQVDRDFSVFGRTVVLLPVMHGELDILGFRFGDLAYITDASRIPESTFMKMEGVKLLIINALRYRRHSTHFSVNEAVETARRTTAKTVRFVHLAHQVDHAGLAAALPAGFAPGRDGETLEFNW